MKEIHTSCKVAEIQTKEIDVAFVREEKTTADGRPYISLDNENYNILLFPSSVKPAAGAKSRILYNARITLKESGVTFFMPVKELKDGSLIAGQKSASSGKWTVLYDWSAEKQISYERMAIPERNYQEIMAMVAESAQ